MTQEEINQAEWRNPDNWGGPPMMALYFSKKDTRTWVPKRIPWMGWTLNLARTAGVCWLIGLLVGMPVVLIVITVAVLVSRG